jgi:hypothetical protein
MRPARSTQGIFAHQRAAGETHAKGTCVASPKSAAVPALAKRNVLFDATPFKESAKAGCGWRQ